MYNTFIVHEILQPCRSKNFILNSQPMRWVIYVSCYWNFSDASLCKRADSRIHDPIYYYLIQSKK